MKQEPVEVKVTKINSWFHVRIMLNGKLWQESKCSVRQDIGYVARSIMRMIDKCGVDSDHAASARRRHAKDGQPAGRIVWNLMN